MKFIAHMKTKNNTISLPPLGCLRSNSLTQLHRKFAKPVMQNSHLIESHAYIN